MANSVDPNGMAHYEPSHQDLHCLQKQLFWSTGQNHPLTQAKSIPSKTQQTLLETVAAVQPTGKSSSVIIIILISSAGVFFVSGSEYKFFH